MGEDYKICATCKKLKHINAFLTNSGTISKKNMCRTCVAEKFRKATSPENAARLFAEYKSKLRPHGMQVLNRCPSRPKGSELFSHLRPDVQKVARALLARYIAANPERVTNREKFGSAVALAIRWAKFKTANPGVNFGKILERKKRYRRTLLTRMGLRRPTPDIKKIPHDSEELIWIHRSVQTNTASEATRY